MAGLSRGSTICSLSPSRMLVPLPASSVGLGPPICGVHGGAGAGCSSPLCTQPWALLLRLLLSWGGAAEQKI